jgi:formate hydrogenlyase subunit 3/multisubunit Na+/H+ antiporter MnhD subunit
LTLACLVHAGYVVFWGKLRFAGPAPSVEPREVPASMSFAMIVLAGLALLIGVYPHVLYPLLDGATRCVLQIMAAA